MKINDLKNISKSYDSVYIYGFGIAGKWLANKLEFRVSGFIDTDSKKSGQIYNGIKVRSYLEALNMVGQNSLIIISIIDIQDVLDMVKNTNCKSSLALGLYLDDYEENLCELDGETAEFIGYSLNAVKKCHEGHFSEDTLFLRSVDLVITEKCSLKCKDCSNLMQYYESPRDINILTIEENMNLLLANVDYIYEVRLIGGEPFMNKEIYSILEYLYTLPKIEKIVIYTNGMIPLKLEKIDILRNPKLVFSVTDYGDIAKNTHKVIKQIEQLGLVCRSHAPEYWTDSGKIVNFDRSQEDMEKLFAACCGKNLITLSDDKLYRCPFAANADRLGAVPKNKSNYVHVDESQEEIKKYTRSIKFIPACNFCNGRSFDAQTIEPAIQTKKPLQYIKHEK